MEYRNIKEINEALKNHVISVQELVEEKIKIINKNEENLKVFITTDFDNALEHAKKLDSEGVFKHQTGIMTGIPYGVKDNIFTKGLKTTGGSKLYADFVPDFDSRVIEKCKILDSVMLGKLNLDELGVGERTESHFGQTRNPYNLEKDTNGSSGGSAVFVSAGYGAFAYGSDTGGSIREPAGRVGCVGFKPTYGFLKTNGVMHYAKSLDHLGVFTNSVFDALIATSASSRKIRNHTKFDYTDFECLENELTPDIRVIKVGYFKEIFESSTNEEYTKVWEFLQSIKDNKRIELVELSLPEIYETREIYRVKTAIEGIEEFTSHTDDISVYGDRVRLKIAEGEELLQDKKELKRIRKLENKIVKNYNRFFDDVNIIITPLSSFHKDINLITLANLTRTPAVALPLCIGSEGIPMGLQVCGEVFEDRKLLRKAKFIEDLIGFKNKPTQLIK